MSARCRKSSERQDKIDECDPAMFDEFRKENARKFRGFEAPLKNIEAVQVAMREAVRRASSKSASCSWS